MISILSLSAKARKQQKVAFSTKQRSNHRAQGHAGALGQWSEDLGVEPTLLSCCSPLDARGHSFPKVPSGFHGAQLSRGSASVSVTVESWPPTPGRCSLTRKCLIGALRLGTQLEINKTHKSHSLQGPQMSTCQSETELPLYRRRPLAIAFFYDTFFKVACG